MRFCPNSTVLVCAWDRYEPSNRVPVINNLVVSRFIQKVLIILRSELKIAKIGNNDGNTTFHL
jgi:hypothetical protein